MAQRKRSATVTNLARTFNADDAGGSGGTRAPPARADRALLPDAGLHAFEAEDALQETFIRAWRGFDRSEGRAELRW